MNKVIAIILGILAIVGVVYLVSRPSSLNAPENTTTNQNTQTQESKDNNEISQPQPNNFTINYTTDGSFQAQTYRVRQGETVVITVNSVVTEEIHLHGINLFAEVAPNVPGVIEFTANQTGRFEFEFEGSGKVLGVIEVIPN